MGDARQRKRKAEQRALAAWIVHRKHVEHAAGLLRDSLLERLHVAVLEMQDAICDVENTVVVGDEDDARPLFSGELLNQISDIAARVLVERGRGLVGQDDFRLVDERAGDRHALTLAARELPDSLVHVLRHADAVEHPEDLLALLRAGSESDELGGHPHVLLDVECRQQVVALEDVPDPPPHLDEGAFASAAQLLAEDAQAALLPGAERSHQSE